MPVTASQVENAKQSQLQAAHDDRPQVRLVSGPGTGKSHTIQERVAWLIGQGVPPNRIFVVSYTRASTRDLGQRIVRHLEKNGTQGAKQVNVSTLHSLALRSLRRAQQLYYAVNPCVMDKWELEHVLDEELRIHSGWRRGRCKEVREAYEAFCQTGKWLPPSYAPPDPLITDDERLTYEQFASDRTRIYSCVLPGEIVRQCTEHIQAGILSPADLLGMEHLIVDEYQDLNPVDLLFVDQLIEEGVVTFVAGDDDQSIYSFRYASPQGIQSFLKRHGEAGDHVLEDCFRCTPMVLSAATTLIKRAAEPQRIPKDLVSLYEDSDPPVPGIVHRWKHASGQHEARAVASSCAALVGGGLSPDRIMVLYSYGPIQLQPLQEAFDEVGLSYSTHYTNSFATSCGGRFVQALMRVVCEPDDYVAHRLILGLRPNVGAGTCNTIAEQVASNGLNYGAIFRRPLPVGVFRGRALSALQTARSVLGAVSKWTPDDPIAIRCPEVEAVLLAAFGEREAKDWLSQASQLPDAMTLAELRDYLCTERDEERIAILGRVAERLGVPVQDHLSTEASRVRIITMHGAKGLDAEVVFIPGLEQSLLPGPKRGLYPSQVMEAARLLYVSITRAKVARVLAYANRRLVFGKMRYQAPSQFATSLGGTFRTRDGGGLLTSEVESILRSCRCL